MSGPNASVSRCARPAVGSSSSRTRAPSASWHASSVIRRVPVERFDTNSSANRSRPTYRMISSASAALRPFARGRRREREHRRHDARPVATLPARPSTVSRTVRSSYRRAAWKPRPRPSRARRYGGSPLTSRPSTSMRPDDGHEAADGVHQRRLARAVGADEPDDLAGVDVQAHRGRPRCGHRSAP